MMNVAQNKQQLPETHAYLAQKNTEEQNKLCPSGGHVRAMAAGKRKQEGHDVPQHNKQ